MARFNRILERTDDANRDVETSFASGEISTADLDTEMAFIHAAVALRRALDQVRDEGSSDDGTGLEGPSITPEQVVEMVRSNSAFTPCRASWFPYDVGSSSGHAYRESLAFAEEILHCWRKGAQSRREDLGPPARWLTGWPGRASE
ncbi:hypothetical protein A4X09_0g638 [Tilletia walkeri]|uniref:Uncharacterized protein n=1 Tax=Tilletia walkeri TaxID=117179 RepID=A0A8X7T7I6_9BASI|nr:hypothetical protein A4X09_0g638 [Tilletia walkeri]